MNKEELAKRVYEEYVRTVSARRIAELRETYQDEKRWKRIIKKWDGKPISKDLIKDVPFIKNARFEFFEDKGKPCTRERKGSLYEGYMEFNVYGDGVVDAKETLKEIEHIAEWYDIMYKCWNHIYWDFEYGKEWHDEFLSWMSCRNWYACILCYKTDKIDRLLDEWEKKRVEYAVYRGELKEAA